jgi:hypothetical protein
VLWHSSFEIYIDGDDRLLGPSPRDNPVYHVGDDQGRENRLEHSLGRVPTFASLFEDLAPHRLPSSRERPVQVGRRADQRQMRERLREIAKMLPVAPQLL